MSYLYHPQIARLISITAIATGVPAAEIKGRSRAPEINRARQIVMVIATDYLKCSLPTVARTLGRDHTTIINGRNRMRRDEPTDQLLALDISAIIAVVAERKPASLLPHTNNAVDESFESPLRERAPS
jgi:chromosomal replication initiation ATPase DnaA